MRMYSFISFVRSSGQTLESKFRLSLGFYNIGKYQRVIMYEHPKITNIYFTSFIYFLSFTFYQIITYHICIFFLNVSYNMEMSKHASFIGYDLRF